MYGISLSTFVCKDNLNLTGTIPPELAVLTSLQDISLERNALEGPVPNSFGHTLPNLLFLSLGKNTYLSGTIPLSIVKLRRLQLLDLMNNALTGTIPVTLFSMTDLDGVYLLRNNLSGTIPEVDPKLVQKPFCKSMEEIT